MNESEIKLVRNYLKNPGSVELSCFKCKFDFERIKLEEKDDLLDIFSIDHFKLTRGEDFLEKYSDYENIKILYNDERKTLIIYVQEEFLVLSLGRKSLEKIIEEIKKSSLKDFLTYSDIENLINTSQYVNLPYPFFLEEFSKYKKDISTDFYYKLDISINAFTNAIKDNKELQHYVSSIIVSSLLEELFYYISEKEGLFLNGDYNIANCIRKFKGEKWLVTSHPKKNNNETLNILSKESDGKIIFNKGPGSEGDRIRKLLDEINMIRKKYVHFNSQNPNNPSDNLVVLVNFGQFLIWCEENGYL